MATQSRDIAEAIRTLSGMDDLTYESSVCTIIKGSIDTTNMTCDCDPLDGSAYLLDVRLNANYTKGFTLIPKDESIVIVTQLSDATAYVSMVSEVDEIYLAGDANGGLVKVQIASTAFNTLQTEINTLKAAITALMAGYAPIDGGAALATFNLIVLPQIDISQIENNKVLHGNG